jgi:hypothetical protein
LMTISGTPIPLSVMHCIADPLVSAGQCVYSLRIKKLATVGYYFDCISDVKAIRIRTGLKG